MRASFVAAIVLSVLSTSATGLAEEEGPMQFLWGQKSKAFIDPAGFWSAVLPAGFDCQTRARHVECKGNRGANALLTVDVVDVPASANADIAMLNQIDRFKEKPHFKLLGQGNTQIDGSPAAVVTFSYDHLNNIELPVGVQQLVFVRQGKLILIHLECGLSHFSAYKADLEQLYRSFKPARVDAGGNPILEDLKPSEDTADVSKVMKGRY